ncbi:hypothetical protein DPMN_070167 [Dreissena polymorpha]|uniref:Uncharacterized protein n=1 Tax=Dreissena polymorpha TaxID=45954 RepID=A0A9D3Z4W2_DREPO|nr:hypothetical protein DPMN_070167 [Dreissena polymorpha]
MNTNHPEAAVIARDLYIAHVMSSFHIENNTLSYFRHARDLKTEAGLNPRSWASKSER